MFDERSWKLSDRLFGDCCKLRFNCRLTIVNDELVFCFVNAIRLGRVGIVGFQILAVILPGHNLECTLILQRPRCITWIAVGGHLDGKCLVDARLGCSGGRTRTFTDILRFCHTKRSAVDCLLVWAADIVSDFVPPISIATKRFS